MSDVLNNEESRVVTSTEEYFAKQDPFEEKYLSEHVALRDQICKVLKDMQSEDTVIFAMQQGSHMGECVILTSATSQRHSSSMSEKVIAEIGKEVGIYVEGSTDGNWVILSMGIVVLHIFRKEVREYYDVDKLWEGVCVCKVRV